MIARNCRQITLVTLNGFCPLSKPSTPLPALKGQHQDVWNTNQNLMKNTLLFYIVFQVLKVLLIKICKMSHQIIYFLLFYTSFYINRHHFSQIFRTSLNIICKNIFVRNFPFLTDSLKPPHPVNGQNPLSMTKVFCRFSPSSLYMRFLINNSSNWQCFYSSV